jgi:hypothetical protein
MKKNLSGMGEELEGVRQLLGKEKGKVAEI